MNNREINLNIGDIFYIISLDKITKINFRKYIKKFKVVEIIRGHYSTSYFSEDMKTKEKQLIDASNIYLDIKDLLKYRKRFMETKKLSNKRVRKKDLYPLRIIIKNNKFDTMSIHTKTFKYKFINWLYSIFNKNYQKRMQYLAGITEEKKWYQCLNMQ